MAQKPIKPELLWQVLFWVPYQYSKRPQQYKGERPIRAFREFDGSKAAKLIKTIRMARHYQLKAWRDKKRSEPDFEILKKLVVNSMQMEHSWDDQTRNYLSSVASTYITWDSQGQSGVSVRKLEILASYAKAFYDPNGTMRGVLDV